MNRFILQQTIRAIVEDARPKKPLPEELSSEEAEWMEAWVVWAVVKSEELTAANTEGLSPTEISEVVIEALTKELTEELLAPVPPV